jgi:hypothetical protein
MPEPLPTGRVVKKGSNICDRFSAGMPQPLSLMVTEIRSASRLAQTVNSSPSERDLMASLVKEFSYKNEGD